MVPDRAGWLISFGLFRRRICSLDRSYALVDTLVRDPSVREEWTRSSPGTASERRSSQCVALGRLPDATAGRRREAAGAAAHPGGGADEPGGSRGGVVAGPRLYSSGAGGGISGLWQPTAAARGGDLS